MLGLCYLYSLSFQHGVLVSLLFFILGLHSLLLTDSKLVFFKAVHLALTGLFLMGLSLIWLSPSKDIAFLMFILATLLVFVSVFLFRNISLSCSFEKRKGLSPLLFLSLLLISELIF